MLGFHWQALFTKQGQVLWRPAAVRSLGAVGLVGAVLHLGGGLLHAVLGLLGALSHAVSGLLGLLLGAAGHLGERAEGGGGRA